jgi:hypothetical protein
MARGGTSRQEKPAVRKRSIRAAVIAALALLTALGCVVASVPLHAKQYPLPERPRQVAPPPVHLIKCAAALDGWQCWPDPGMMRRR